MGFPSRRARSRASNRAPGEILVQDWKGSDNEKALVSIHPERFEDVQQVARAVLFVIGNEVYGSRRNLGSLSLGIEMDRNTGDLMFTSDDKGKHAEVALNQIVRTLGAIPQGFAEMPELKAVQRTKAQKYSCTVCGTNVRYANGVTQLQALCLHAGKPQFGQNAAAFALQVKPVKPVKQSKVVAIPAPAQPKPALIDSNIENVIAAVKHGAARVVHGGRNFGAEVTA